MAILPADEYAGRLIITWPKPGDGATPVHGWGVQLTNADTGQPILSALSSSIAMGPHEPVTAELTMLTDAHGYPLEGDRSALPTHIGDSNVVYSGRFRWLVTEMRIAE